MITPKDLETNSITGYKNVANLNNSVGPHSHGGGRPYILRISNRGISGPRRATALEAAQDYCDYINTGKLPMPKSLKSAGHNGSRDPIKDPEVVAALGVLRDARAQRKGVPGYVYCIGEKGTKKVKVGYSTKPEARIAELQTGNPRVLRLIGKVRGTEADERNLHRKYSDLNILQEWFKATPELLAEFA